MPIGPINADGEYQPRSSAVDEPVVYVSSWRIKEGRFDAYLRFYDQLRVTVDREEPDVIAFVAYANENRTEIVNVHVFPDHATLDRHMQILGQFMKLVPGDLAAVLQLMEPLGIQVYGQPSGAAAEMDQGLRDAGVPFTDRPRYVGGFVRKRRLTS
jgi:hypothetical protein